MTHEAASVHLYQYGVRVECVRAGAESCFRTAARPDSGSSSRKDHKVDTL